MPSASVPAHEHQTGTRTSASEPAWRLLNTVLSVPKGPACMRSLATDPALRRGAGFLAVLRTLALPAENLDATTVNHSERVATYSSEIAEALGFGRTEMHTLHLGAYLHDVGKLLVPPEILRKPGRLTDAEYAVMKLHPVWGLGILEGVRLPSGVRAVIRWHHEKCDGTGYPDGLRGYEIPLLASVVAIADVYDALTSARSYRLPMSSSGALELMRARRAWWPPEVYAAFCRAVASTARGPALMMAGAAATRRREAAARAAA